MVKHNDISVETQNEAMAIAKKTQKPGQTKDQTRLIALGIQKGIAEYKKSAKSKQRQADKAGKKKKTQPQQAIQDGNMTAIPQRNSNILPWGLLIISWLLFALFIVYKV